MMLHNRYLVPGGEDLSTLAEASLLRESGCEVELLEEDNRRIAELGNLKTAVRTIWSTESFQRIRAALRMGRFDILHVQNFFPLWSPSVYYAAAQCGVPVVQTLRNYRLMCVNSTFFRENRACEDCLGKFAPWAGIRHACYRNNRAGSAVVAAMIGLHKLRGTWRNRVNSYIALTEFARQKYIAGGLPAESIVVKPNFLHPAPASGNGAGGYALVVGRMSAEKGIMTMLAAWKIARNPLPLKIVGDGPLAETVATEAASMPAVQYLGRQSPDEALELMRHAALLVFPSQCYEGMPRTIIESFAAGTPVVASNIGAMASMIVPEETGFHFSPGNAAELRDRIDWCSANLAGLHAMRVKARAAFAASYSGPANVEMLKAIYHKTRIAQHLTHGNK